MKRFPLAFAAMALAAIAIAGTSLAAMGGSGGVTGPAFYVDGTLYRTVPTPTNLSDTGAPSPSFDTIYAFPLGTQPYNVATAAPGDAGYNGGRWQVHALAFNSGYADAVAQHDLNGSGDLDSDEEIAAALVDPDAGGAQDLGVVRSFVCPVIKLPAGGL